ncbi:uncharacterized protein LTHEOB_3473 [Neofusicoccum parvum]|uniref:Uncharacterized protein LTHEOB_3473 n=2 Tax=Neofusicoccum parvum TaxID=310453 RepID=A0ACB5S122_9PEZI|nr:putative duf1275 domain protein [Neofusicoccum parvum UCRNP2]GME26462.1 uncharacterized protein LTHEOB_3473 [Neofusicoccum parvum]GME42827.1 uncharacterized protein LTHEOB_3473 [Neofusicoccum parvum]
MGDFEKEKCRTPDFGLSRTATPASLEAQDAVPLDLDVELLTLPPLKRWRAYLNQQIAVDTLLELELYMLSFATGIQDAMTFAFYGVFCSKQTGNLVTIALSALDSKAVVQTETHIAVSFTCFLAGAALFGHFNNFIGKKRRGWLIFVNAWQTLLVIAACAIRKVSVDRFGILDEESPDPYAVASIALLAFASGGQISLALSVGLAEINTTMVTGAMVMLAHDKKVLHKHNPGRNRKLFFIGSILGGSFVGAVANRYAHSALSLLLVSICKVVVTLMFLCNRGVNKKPGSTDTAESSVSLAQVVWGD